MSAEAWGILAVVGYSLAGVLAVIALIWFFTQNIRQVRSDLTGRTAQRAIAELRSGEGNRSRFFGGEDRGAAARVAGALGVEGGDESESGNLKLRFFSSHKGSTGKTGRTKSGHLKSGSLFGSGKLQKGHTGQVVAPAASGEAAEANASESSTTLLGVGQTGETASMEEAEGSTTLLGAQQPAASAASSESSTTLLSQNDSAPEIETREASDEASESGTTLLTDAASDGETSSADEAGTTLLSSDDAPRDGDKERNPR